MSLTIVKEGNKNFQHQDADYDDYGANDITIIFDGNNVKLRSLSGRIIFNKDGYNYTDVTIIDNSTGGGSEVFANVVLLKQRLINLGYPFQGGLSEIVLDTVEWGNLIGDILNQTDLIDYINENTAAQQNPVENVYADNATMFADQVNQTTGFFNYVTSGDNHYEKLPTNTASISDYRLLGEDEVITIQDSSSYRIFSISDIQDDAVPLTSVGGGKIGIEYDSVSDNVTGLFFNARYTNIIANIIALDATLDYYIRLYNGTSRFYDLFKVTGFAVVNTDYVLCSVDPTVDRTVYSVNDRVEVNFDVDVAGGGSTPNLQQVTDVAPATTTTPITTQSLKETGGGGVTLQSGIGTPICGIVLGNDIRFSSGNSTYYIFGGTGSVIKNLSNITGNRLRTEPDKDGTYAMTSDVPTVRSRTVITGTSATTYDLDISAGIRWDLEATGNLTLTYSNPVIDGDSNQIYLTTGGFTLTLPADWTAYPNSESITGATLVMIVFDVLVIDGGGNDIRYNITVVE